MAEASRRKKKNQRQRVDSKPVDADAEIRAANQELELRVGSKLELPITLLVEQRNRALRIAQVAREQPIHPPSGSRDRRRSYPNPHGT